MGLVPIPLWMLYGLWVASNHLHTGTALLCHGKCFESDGDPTSHRHFWILGENAPRCTNPSDRKMWIPCGEDVGYAGCKTDYIKTEDPVPVEFILYGCDRSNHPAGWYNATRRDAVAYRKCTTELCNVPSGKNTQPITTAVSVSSTQAPYASTAPTEPPAFGKIGILLPISNAMTFSWTAFINNIKSFKF